MNEKLDKINNRIKNIKTSEDYIKFVVVLMNVFHQLAEVMEE